MSCSCKWYMPFDDSLHWQNWGGEIWRNISKHKEKHRQLGRSQTGQIEFAHLQPQYDKTWKYISLFCYLSAQYSTFCNILWMIKKKRKMYNCMLVSTIFLPLAYCIMQHWFFCHATSIPLKFWLFSFQFLVQLHACDRWTCHINIGWINWAFFIVLNLNYGYFDWCTETKTLSKFIVLMTKIIFCRKYRSNCYINQWLPTSLI